MRYIVHAKTCVLHNDEVLQSNSNDLSDVVGFKKPASLGDFDIINFAYKVFLPHKYDANKLLLKINIDVDDEETREHIITVKTYVKMKKITNSEYEKDLSIYEANIKIFVPIL